jgi:exodeoxyribonuclease (lambda-induced)
METNKFVLDALQHAAQNTIAWDKMRLGRFTGSQVSSLFTEPRTKADKDAGKLSQTAQKYVFLKAMEEVTGLSNDDAYGRAIDWGNEWEEHALQKVAQFIGSTEEQTQLKPSFKLFNEYSGASPDAIMFDARYNLEVGVEVKCPFNSVNHYMHTQVVNGETLKEVNEDYYWQVQMNMLTFGKTCWLFCSFDPRQPEHRMLHVALIHAHAEDMEEMCKRMERANEMKRAIVAQWLQQ